MSEHARPLGGPRLRRAGGLVIGRLADLGDHRIFHVGIDYRLVAGGGGLDVVAECRHGTNTTFDTLASSPTDRTSIRMRHSRGASSPPAVRDLTATATSTWAESPRWDSSPASVTVPSDFDCAALTTSMNGLDRCSKSSRKAPVAKSVIRCTSA